MACERYYELLSARVDRELPRDEAEEVELHLAGCSRCRIVWEQMEETREAFAHLEEVPAPEGFAQGVMDRVQKAEAEPKLVPLFKRPQVRALAGLAACLVLAAGLYGAACPRPVADGARSDWMPRSFSRSAGAAESASGDAQEDIPQITAYAAPEIPAGDGIADDPDTDSALAELTLTLDRLPQGEEMEELLLIQSCTLPDAQGHVCLYTSQETLELTEQLAQEQGISASRTAGPEANGCYIIVILNATEAGPPA